jgi:hypothetical protein
MNRYRQGDIFGSNLRGLYGAAVVINKNNRSGPSRPPGLRSARIRTYSKLLCFQHLGQQQVRAEHD